MFGTSEIKNIQAKLISCFNKEFSISNRDKGMARRGTVQFYRSQFLKGDKQVDPSKHIYQRVDNYKNTFDSEEYKNTLTCICFWTTTTALASSPLRMKIISKT